MRKNLLTSLKIQEGQLIKNSNGRYVQVLRWYKPISVSESHVEEDVMGGQTYPSPARNFVRDNRPEGDNAYLLGEWTDPKPGTRVLPISYFKIR